MAYSTPPIEGVTWVCTACGKNNALHRFVGDESCFMHAEPCDAASLKFDERGRVVAGTALPEEKRKELGLED